jgi:anti-anti-sigma regulatory factor
MSAGKIPFVLNLGATLNVEKAAALRGEIVDALASGESVSVSFSAVEELDLSCLQVLYAALASARSSGRDLHFVGSLSHRVAGRLRACGFLAGSQEQAADLETAMGLLS